MTASRCGLVARKIRMFGCRRGVTLGFFVFPATVQMGRFGMVMGRRLVMRRRLKMIRHRRMLCLIRRHRLCNGRDSGRGGGLGGGWGRGELRHGYVPLTIVVINGE